MKRVSKLNMLFGLIRFILCMFGITFIVIILRLQLEDCSEYHIEHRFLPIKLVKTAETHCNKE